jgi:hypothetical protein
MLGQNGSPLDQRKDGAPSGQRPAATDERGRKLSEVRAVLEKLQRIGTEPEGEGAEDIRGQKAGQGRKLGSGWILAAGVGAIALLGAGGLALKRLTAPSPQKVVVAVKPPAPAVNHEPAAVNLAPAKVEPMPAVQPLSPSPAPSGEDKLLTDAERLIDSGRIAEARGLLTPDFASNSPEAALMLARSYDPNILRHLASANAEPDVDEAERWYRVWYSGASAKGLQMEPERLDRIIRAMR